MARVLVVEDDAPTADEIVLALSGVTADIAVSHHGEAALALALQGDHDLIVLDRMLPGLDGLALVAALRAAGVDTPVLMLSALSDVDERIAGLRAGGDDYLAKPFVPGELVARAEALLRRAGGAGEATRLACGPLVIDRVQRLVTVGGEPIRLLHMEFRLLEFLARNAGRTVSRQMIFEQVWGYRFDPGANLIAVHIGRLRRKLARPGFPTPIETVKGEGYRIDAG